MVGIVERVIKTTEVTSVPTEVISALGYVVTDMMNTAILNGGITKEDNLEEISRDIMNDLLISWAEDNLRFTELTREVESYSVDTK